MRLVSFNDGAEIDYGAVLDDEIVPLRTKAGDGLSSLAAVLKEQKLDMISELARESSVRMSPKDVQLLPPIIDPAIRIFCVGLNYVGHRSEVIDAGNGPEVEPQHYPTVFLRLPESHVGHGASVIRPAESSMLDYEGELAVVMARSGRRIPATEAMDYVGGYSCYNDFTVRDWQFQTSQWTAGKNFLGVGSFGPYLVTADEVGDISKVELETRVNGEIRQSEIVGHLITSIPDLIAYISTFTVLSPGDVIVTGTPAGVGMAMDPPRLLELGDEVEVEISGVGLLQNIVGGN